jgi:hypothetical protein
MRKGRSARRKTLPDGISYNGKAPQRIAARTREETMDIERFKHDHVTVLTAIKTLRELTQAGIPQNAGAIAKTVVTISSAIKLHLAAENRFLYPALAGSANQRVAEVGKKFQLEMGDIAAAYMEFAGKWNLEGKVATHPEEFRVDANSVFKALHQRIQRENRELYPLAERA